MKNNEFTPPPLTKKQRYYLHGKLRAIGYEVNARKRKVSIPSSEFEAKIYKKKIVEKYLKQLVNAGYGIQSTIV